MIYIVIEQGVFYIDVSEFDSLEDANDFFLKEVKEKTKETRFILAKVLEET